MMVSGSSAYPKENGYSVRCIKDALTQNSDSAKTNIQEWTTKTINMDYSRDDDSILSDSVRNCIPNVDD